MASEKFKVGDRVSFEAGDTNVLRISRGTVVDVVGDWYTVRDANGKVWGCTPRQLRRLKKAKRREWWLVKAWGPFGEDKGYIAFPEKPSVVGSIRVREVKSK